VKDFNDNPIPKSKWEYFVKEFAQSWGITYEESERFHRDLLEDLKESCKKMEQNEKV